MPWASMGQWLRERLPPVVDVEGMLAREAFVYDDGTPVRAVDGYRPHTFVWFHRELRDEPAVPGEVHVLHRDDRLVVVDKPPFLSTIPRGRHVRESVVVRLREALDLPELSPAHRLDRVTSGVLVLTTERRWRGAYQSLFADRAVRKTYRALAPARSDLAFPLTVRNHVRKRHGTWQAEIVPGVPVNAETVIDLERIEGDAGHYRLTPLTGRTHQLRVHLASLGLPIFGDPLYPEVADVAVDDFSMPLQLLAHAIELTDPIDGTVRRFESRRTLPLSPS